MQLRGEAPRGAGLLRHHLGRVEAEVQEERTRALRPRRPLAEGLARRSKVLVEPHLLVPVVSEGVVVVVAAVRVRIKRLVLIVLVLLRGLLPQVSAAATTRPLVGRTVGALALASAAARLLAQRAAAQRSVLRLVVHKSARRAGPRLECGR